jgi:hypothetical protein
MSRLFSKLAGFLLGSPQLERKLVCEIHGSRAVFRQSCCASMR